MSRRPRQVDSSELWDAGLALLDAASAQHRVELAQTDSRIKRLIAADSLYKAGRRREANQLAAQVLREQRALGMLVEDGSPKQSGTASPAASGAHSPGAADQPDQEG